MLKVAIVGGTGYTGVELLRILALHPQAEVVYITSRSEEGVRVADMYPSLREHYPALTFSNPDARELGVCDVVFFATSGGRRVSHAGIYVGDGRFVHAPSTGGTVRLDSLDSPYWQKAYLNAKRFIAEAD